ncbi:MAG TPA: Gfo/Idh/MocA family oxidoreductase [Candidatus Dormibacteraeota bacterium]|jgi:predicted dehydrogenase|nr:Gfo/Idh/MocA family oxidoreductase [Candidatus Dormibacteraeota bacterium]
MSAENSSRREFLKLTGAGVAGAALSASASSYSRILGANDRVGVGIVGFSDRCRSSLIPSFLKSAPELNFEFVALSDIWNRRRDEGAAYINKLTGKQIALARNNDELYDNKNVQAVIVATADFQHAFHGVEAIHAGRDAYVEKPLAHTMEDAKAIRDAVKKNDRVFAVGTQRRSSSTYQKAYEFIKSGQFGDIVSVEMTWNVNQPGRWRRAKLVPQLREEDTDWKRYLINHPHQPFDARKYLEFRLFWPFSSGIPDQWLVHQIDTVHWFTGLPHPRSVVANGGVYKWHDGRQNWDTMTAVFDYGPLDDPSKGFQVIYSSRMTNANGGIKEMYFSNGGTLDLDKNEITPEGGLTEKSAAEMDMKANQLAKMSLTQVVTAASTAADTGADDMTVANVRNWMECVRSRKTTNANIDAGYSHSIALCMNVAAIQTGQRITFDDAKQQVVIGGKS